MGNRLKKNLPVLRFPEFVGDWQKKNLKEISVSGFSNGVFNDPSKVGRGYRLINVKDMYSGESVDIDTLTRLEMDKKEFLNNQAKYGDIFFTRSSLVKEGIAHSNVLLSQAEDITYDGHLIKLSPRQNIYLPQFIAAALKNSTSRRQLVARGKTGTMTTIGQEDIATVKLNIPPIAEQEKIASFLGAVDTRITQLRRKHELLQAYKRGVMQKIFSQQIRFKCDREKLFPDWEKKRLESIFSEFKSGYNITSDELTESGSYPVFGGNGIRGYSEKFTHEGFYFLIGRQSALCGNIHRSYGKAYISEHAIACKANDTSDTEWLAQRLDYYNLNKLSESSAQPGLAVNKLLRFKLLTPCKKEQEKIADFLTAIDKKIEAAAKQIELIKQFKKGLLQKMFV
jgi:type I restriction enzyme S subunit